MGTLHPADRVVQALRARGISVRFRADGQGRARCPGHPDQRPSLSIKRIEHGVLLHCHAGCRPSTILAALGLRLQDLFTGPGQSRTRAPIIAIYSYCDRNGTVRARKFRSAPKQFFWQHPDPNAPDGWRNGLGGAGLPGLYRWPELEGARQVFIAEGEKAVDRLQSLGLIATCGPAGASIWKEQWSKDLLATIATTASITILADNDVSGRRHVERVAADLHRHSQAVTVRVVSLAGQPPSGDVVDWLDAGNTIEELLRQAFECTAPWWPGAADARRRQDRNDKARARMRKHRGLKKGIDPSTAASGPADSDAMALSAVRIVLGANEPLSGRGIKSAIKTAMGDTAPPRLAIERILARVRGTRWLASSLLG